jgi:predicted amidophosphoribosyltransferase
MTAMQKHPRRIQREQETIAAMLRVYCRDHHGAPVPPLCPECAALLDYARRRLATCPFQEAKPACNHCEVHCYSAAMRDRVKAVMRYAGPRMLWRHPVLSLFHLLDTWRPVPRRPG